MNPFENEKSIFAKARELNTYKLELGSGMDRTADPYYGSDHDAFRKKQP